MVGDDDDDDDDDLSGFLQSLATCAPPYVVLGS